MGYRGQYELAMAIRTACIWEVSARKVGNVHRYADFADTTYLDFILSAGQIADHLANVFHSPVQMERRDGFIGASIEAAVRATSQVSRVNTNLGMILLLAPLAGVLFNPAHQSLLPEVERVLARLSVKDASYAYRAIRLAQAGGIGEVAEQDVKDEPSVTLLEAMKLAADRDMIARQYASGFADVFDFGVPAFLEGFQRFGCVEAAIIDSQLRWLAAYPDSLIARKNGPPIAADVQKRAAEVLALGGIATAEGRGAGVALDQHLRSDGNRLNPGTTADLITACLFVALRENKLVPSAPFRWPTSDWL